MAVMLWQEVFSCEFMVLHAVLAILHGMSTFVFTITRFNSHWQYATSHTCVLVVSFKVAACEQSETKYEQVLPIRVCCTIRPEASVS